MALRPWVSYRLMALLTKNLVYSAGADLGGMEATNASGYLLYVGGCQRRLGLGDIRYGSSDALIHNILHFGTGKSCVLAVTATGQQRKQQYGHDSQRDRSESIHAQPLLPLPNCLIWTSFGNRTLQSTNILSIGIAVSPYAH